MSGHSSDIHTPRLKLIPATIDHLRVELDTPERLGALLGAEVPASWPPGVYDRDAMQFFVEKAQQGGEEVLGWYGWYALQPASSETKALLVASAGYSGPPTADGTVEIGYSVANEERGKRYATEMIKALTQRAFEDSRVRHVVAEVHESNTASWKALSRAGFVRIGAGREEGYWRYEFQPH